MCGALVDQNSRICAEQVRRARTGRVRPFGQRAKDWVHFFEVDRYWVTVFAALMHWPTEGTIDRQARRPNAIKKYALDPAKPNPDDG